MPLKQSENCPNKKIVGGKVYFYDQKKYNKTYYQKNKNKLVEKITCEFCGKTIRKSGKSEHQKSKYCQFAQKFIKVPKETETETLSETKTISESE